MNTTTVLTSGVSDRGAASISHDLRGRLVATAIVVSVLLVWLALLCLSPYVQML